MGISDRDRKMLWAQAGNRCSYRYGDEVCNESLVFEDNGKLINVGEECHIVGEKSSAARYIVDYPDRETYSNRILMCRKHHKVIDDHEEVYTIEVLQAMKLEHEQIVTIATSNMTLPRQSVPNLSLRMFRPEDRSRLYQEKLSFDLSGRPYSWTRDFGLVLENTTPSSVAKHISIRILISWGGGEQLKKAPSFDSPASVKGWRAEPKLLVNEYPAVLTFKDSDFVSIYGHPEEWSGFRLTIYENWSGIFRLNYSVSSIEPFTESSGELSISISHHS